ncbi:hypothetical protein BDZ45DRAFT_761066 [Acephala macrosclerotiorum]|nr:hypothetical protein BDZ45DRAFT_761066 [Acephala macrosclerotiorum]
MNTAECNRKLNPVQDISPDGDLVLVVGPWNVRLRIQSQCLRCASEVFGAMFSPNWSEDQGLSKEYPQEVPLVEDDADALRTICCVIHHRNDDMSQFLTPKEILQIAIEVDKYDLKIALKYASVQWLKPRDNADRVDKGYLLAAAFIFGDIDTFVAHTLALILHYKGSYLEFLDDEITSQVVPLKTFYLLEERRTGIRAELSQLLVSGQNDTCSCGWGKGRSDKYKLLLSKYGPMKMLEVPVSDVIKKMESVSCEDRESACHSGGYGDYLHKAQIHSETLPGKLETMEKKASICLDCVRSSDAVTPCRFQHE